MALTLTCVARRNIRNKDARLEEPSGLALAHGGNGLWTVSDDSRRVFRLNLDGKLEGSRSFKIGRKGLEGITGDGTGRFLFAVREETNQLMKFDIAAGRSVERRRLSKMKGFKPIKRFFADGKDKNKGLEGITWNRHTGTLFVLKEGEPGLLVEVSPDLKRILSHARLGPKNGFVDPRKRPKEVDFSGICYDPKRRAFWIVSHKARRLFLYNRAYSRVIGSAALKYMKNGRLKRVKQAEGVAVNAASDRLYVLCDKTAELYTYEIRP